MPFAKESPFYGPIQKTLIRLKTAGIYDMIWKKHEVLIDTVCEEKKVLLMLPKIDTIINTIYFSIA